MNPTLLIVAIVCVLAIAVGVLLFLRSQEGGGGPDALQLPELQTTPPLPRPPGRPQGTVSAVPGNLQISACSVTGSVISPAVGPASAGTSSPWPTPFPGTSRFDGVKPVVPRRGSLSGRSTALAGRACAVWWSTSVTPCKHFSPATTFCTIEERVFLQGTVLEKFPDVGI